MCGIGGFVDFNEDIREKKDIGEAMCEALTPRGPDASGLYIRENICLAHRRLIVIDPENGQQPMEISAGSKYVMVYNGELYNTEDIRQQLRSLGHTFAGHSDTEVLLTAYIQWGEECVKWFNGIYAFAIWDEKAQKLFLARDRLGVKPLFYFKTKNGLVFASELKALLCHPAVKPEINEDGLRSIFLLGPAKIPGDGVFRGVRELKQGHCAVLNRDGFHTRAYWKLTAHEHTDSVEQTIEKTRFLIEDAAHRQLVSDVPLCCFLSGGLDSSVLSALAANQYKAEGREPLTTYSVDYVDNDKYFTKSIFQPNSDSQYIDIMAKAIGSNHRSVILQNTELAGSLLAATDARDLPGMADIDSSLMLFCREVKKDFTVCLSGECADELFGGYPWYHNEEILFEDTFPWSRSVALRESVAAPNLLKDGAEFVRAQYLDTINQTSKLDTDSKLEARMREMFMLNLQWFMQTLLDRKDRMSMACGLEVRVPFCDHRIVEYAYSMPWEIKSLDGREKGIVRKAMEGLLPEEILWRKKSPYPKTHNPFYLELVKTYVRRILTDENSAVAPLLNHQTITALMDDPESISEPWFGQLMRAPQIFAYIIQLERWFKKYNVTVI